MEARPPAFKRGGHGGKTRNIMSRLIRFIEQSECNMVQCRAEKRDAYYRRKGKAAETQQQPTGPSNGVGKAPTALSVEHTSTLYPGLLLPAVLPGHDLPGRGQPAQQQQEGAGRKRRPWTGAPASWGLDPDGGLCNAP